MAAKNCWDDESEYDYGCLVDSLKQYLRLRTTPVGMKRFETESELEEIHKLRRPAEGLKPATDQIVGQARWVKYTIGITMDNLVG
ncbi:MAG: hypothetical protein ABGX04_05160 [Myxococcales bacterium]